MELQWGLFAPQPQVHVPGNGQVHLPSGIDAPHIDRPIGHPGFGQRIILFDADKQIIIGGGE